MHRILLCLIPLTACTGLQQTRVYAGPQTPVAGTCTPASRATLTRRGNAVILSPADGTLALPGTIQGTAVAAQTTLTGADKAPYPVAFLGQITGPSITGTLDMPRCRYALRLDLTND